MAATTKPTVSIYRKLAEAREEFLASGIKKTGKNMNLKAMYFTLDDIVPIAMPIFHKHGLMPLTNFLAETASMNIVDMDNPENVIPFTVPIREYLGNAAVTPVQAMGATVTYYRRYLYQIALDIVEADEMEDGTLPTAAPVKPAAALNPVAASVKIPVSEEQREAVKENLTAADGPATELQIKGLKSKLKKLKEKDKSMEDFITKIAVDTKAFTEMTKAQCEQYMRDCNDLLAELEEK